MFVLGAEIDINGISFARVESVKIESSLKVLEDTAVVKLPTTALLKRKEDLITEVETAKVFKPGDEIQIRLGYDGNLKEEFRGYVRKIKPTTPVEIMCEDAIYLLRRKPLKKSFRNTNLKELLRFIVADTGIEILGDPPGITFKKFEFRNTNAAKSTAKN